MKELIIQTVQIGDQEYLDNILRKNKINSEQHLKKILEEKDEYQ